jgi:hypothetical protein
MERVPPFGRKEGRKQRSQQQQNKDILQFLCPFSFSSAAAATAVAIVSVAVTSTSLPAISWY